MKTPLPLAILPLYDYGRSGSALSSNREEERACVA